MRLPEGVSADMTVDKDKNLGWQISFSDDYMIRTIISILDERIKRAEIALKICKHTKRKHQLTKLYHMLIKFRNEQQEKLNNLMNDELPIRLEGSD